MSSQTPEELRQLDERAVSFVPESEDQRRPSTFLSLAPATSDSFPRAQKPQPANAVKKDEGETAKRRSSSLSSDGAKSSAGVRILKLGPVHFGEHQDEHKGDWHDVAVE